jgi:chromosome segregation protein
VAELAAQDEAARAEIATVEEQAGGLRQHLAATENLISEAMEAAVRARTELERLRDQLRNNDDRRQELQQLAERDSKDASEARARLEQHELTLTEQQELRTRHEAARVAAEKELAEHAARLSACEKSLDENARLLHRLRTEQLESESRVAHLQNELSTLEAEERTNILRRERLAAEHAELQRNQQLFQTRSTEVTARQAELKTQTTGLQEQLQVLTSQRRDKATAVGGIKQEISELRAKVAARKAQIDMLQASQAQREGFPEGAKWVLDPKTQLPIPRTQIIGSLAEQLRADAGYELALEAALRPWLDAIVVQDDTSAAALLLELERSGRGSARLVMVAGSTPAAPADEGDLLVRHVRCADPIRPLLERMLGATQVVDTVAQIPSPVPAGAIFVTRQGVRLAADGVAEFWKRGSAQQNPLARRQLLADWQDQLAALLTDVQNREEALARLQQEETSVEEAAAAARERMEESRRALAVVEGEGQVIAREAKQAAQRVETVAWELKSLTEQNAGGDERRTAIHQGIDAQRQRQSDIRTAISTRTEEARDLETRRGQALSDVTERRVLFSESKQQVEAARSRIEQIDARVRELKSLIEERSRGVLGYQKRIEELVAASASAQQQIPPLEQQVQSHNQRLDEARGKRDIMNASLSAQETELRMKREVLEQLRQRRSQGDVELAEQRMRRQTLLDRVVSEYRITSDQITSAPEPAWDNDQRPDRETMETMLAELRTKLEAMGAGQPGGHRGASRAGGALASS